MTSMRARSLDDYEHNRKPVQGDHKDTMNKMFDDRADKQESS